MDDDDKMSLFCEIQEQVKLLQSHLAAGSYTGSHVLVVWCQIPWLPRIMDSSAELEEHFPGIFPACVTTRAQSKFMHSVKDTDVELGKTFLAHDHCA